MSISIVSLINHITKNIETQPIKAQLKDFISNKTSSAGARPEEIFTREFLCPSIARYFYVSVRAELQVSDDEISNCLGTEGFQNCPGFGFTPARKRQQLFTKSDIIKSVPPESWYVGSDKNLSAFQACPDFAIARPLPIAIVGEVKFVSKGSPKSAIKELYNAARQAIFYLGAFQDRYDAALLVVADASPDHSFIEGLKLIKPELLERFGSESNVYLAPVKLR